MQDLSDSDERETPEDEENRRFALILRFGVGVYLIERQGRCGVYISYRGAGSNLDR